MTRPADKVGRRDWLVGRNVLQKALHNRLGYSYREADEIIAMLYDVFWKALLNGRRVRLGAAGVVRCRTQRACRKVLKDTLTGGMMDILPAPSVIIRGRLQDPFKEAWRARYVGDSGYKLFGEWLPEDDDFESEEDDDA